MEDDEIHEDWEESWDNIGETCPHCESDNVTELDGLESLLYKYECNNCGNLFN